MSAQQETARLDIPDIPFLELDFPSPEIPVPPGALMSDTAVFVTPDTPYTTPSVENTESYVTEQRVGRVIASIPYVASVRQAERLGESDQDMIDLEVTMVEGFIVPTFYVQVKSSKWGIASFFDEVGKRMREEAKENGTPLELLTGDAEYKRKKEWLAKRRLIVINGGIRNGKPATKEYIADKFDREMKEVIRINRAQGLITVPAHTIPYSIDK